MLELSRSTLAVALLALVLCGSAWAWARWTTARREQRELISYAMRRPVPWGILDLGVVLLIMVFTQLLAASAGLRLLGFSGKVGDEPSVNAQAGLLALNAAASIAMWLLSLLFIRLRCQATREDLGGWPWCFKQDLLHGAQGFFMIIIPVYAIQFVLMQFFTPDHPLIKLLMENGSLAFFLASGFMAVIVAPVVEEYLFRVILQGWLENLAAARQTGISHEQRMRLWLGHPRTPGIDTDAAQQAADWAAAHPAATVAAPHNPYASPLPPAATLAPLAAAPAMKPAVWPILVSAFLFAMAHFGHAADPIPIFVLALGLGWIYQRTHRVWPCILMHMMLNGLSLIQLALYLNAAP